jgi:hypothetical protein
MFKSLKAFLGFGFKPANDVADAALKGFMNEGADRVIAAPWLGRGGLDRTGRFSAIAAILGRGVGVARRGSAFKFYYSRGLTGRWFAEVWSVWVSAAVAAPLIVAEMSVAPGRMPAMGVAQFLVGAVLTTIFLPRGLLSIGRQFAVASVIGKWSYGPSGLLNIAVGFYGLNAMVASFYKSWDFLGFWVEVIKGNVFFVRNSLYFYLVNEMGGIFLMMVGLASAFWAVAFKYVGARACAQKVFVGMKANTSLVYDLYNGSAQEYATEKKAPQIALGFLAYLVLVLGLVNKPLILTVWGML